MPDYGYYGSHNYYDDVDYEARHDYYDDYPVDYEPHYEDDPAYRAIYVEPNIEDQVSIIVDKIADIDVRYRVNLPVFYVPFYGAGKWDDDDIPF
jgi:hypothetical protein